MIINTKYHGEKEIKPENIITFQNGIPSFEDEEKFILLDLGEESPYVVLQSIHTANVAFLLINPFDFFPDYEFAIPDPIIEKLKIETQEDVITFAILTIREPFDQTTANLQGPIVINSKEKVGKQLVLADENYQTRHHLFKEKASTGEER